MLVIITKFISWAMDFEKNTFSMGHFSKGCFPAIRVTAKSSHVDMNKQRWSYFRGAANLGHTHILTGCFHLCFQFWWVGQGRKGVVGRMKRSSRKERAATIPGVQILHWGWWTDTHTRTLLCSSATRHGMDSEWSSSEPAPKFHSDTLPGRMFY